MTRRSGLGPYRSGVGPDTRLSKDKVCEERLKSGDERVSGRGAGTGGGSSAIV